jgi:hypothetical protein
MKLSRELIVAAVAAVAVTVVDVAVVVVVVVVTAEAAVTATTIVTNANRAGNTPRGGTQWPPFLARARLGLLFSSFCCSVRRLLSFYLLYARLSLNANPLSPQTSRQRFPRLVNAFGLLSRFRRQLQR